MNGETGKLTDHELLAKYNQISKPSTATSAVINVIKDQLGGHYDGLIVKHNPYWEGTMIDASEEEDYTLVQRTELEEPLVEPWRGLLGRIMKPRVTTHEEPITLVKADLGGTINVLVNDQKVVNVCEAVASRGSKKLKVKLGF